MKIAITSQGPDLSSPLDPRFGRARYVLVVDRSSGEVEVVDNVANAQTPQGAGLAAVALLKRYDVDLLVTGRVGPKAEQALRAAEIRVVTVAEGTCRAALEGLEVAGEDP
ncbi:MAG: dinitrogenase iron-molybdenum cofactor biosynthesis protein [bacterium]|nr:dinitrogenase iron-molybdenum cofactor biosynthesis protein [bacterium]